jgi:hypothetical protein
MKMKGKVLFCSLVVLFFQTAFFCGIGVGLLKDGPYVLIPLCLFAGVWNYLIYDHLLNQHINKDQ